jgi:natural product biosynthesis luciferase-like monooxygenase protein
VRGWAQDKELVLFDSGPNLADGLGAARFDFLFCIGHLSMVPNGVIARARRHAFNFHDGPLPRYAGLNATSWALLNGETMHGVSWHEMTETPDAGRLAATETVAIELGETALSLNAKCYEAGFSAFKRLLAQVGSNEIVLVPQKGERSYFGRADRPKHAATLDFRESAESIDALARALHFGPYPNTLASPKLFDGQAIYIVGSVAIAKSDMQAMPGEIIACDQHSLTVATGTAPVQLAKLTSAAGTPIVPSEVPTLAVGRRIAPLDEGLAQRLDALMREAALGEAEWRAALSNDLVELPYPKRTQPHSENRHHVFEVRGDTRCEVRVAALLAWYGRVTGTRSIRAEYRAAEREAALGEAAPWFAAWRLLIATVSKSESKAAFASLCAKQIARVENAAPMTCDLALRLFPAVAADIACPPLAIEIGAPVSPARSSADVLASLDPNSDSVTLCIRADRYEASTAQTMASHIQKALSSFADAGLIDDLDLSPPEERALLETASVGPRLSIGPCLHDQIAEQAVRTPDRIAVRAHGQQFSYKELDARAHAAAARLAQLGASPGAIVGICMNRSADLVTALIAVLKTGAAYLPLDPSYPTDRLRFMLRDSNAGVVVTDRAHQHHSALHEAHTVLIEDLIGAETHSAAWQPPRVDSENLAYLIYTSGSTGQPKGVMVPHRALANFAAGMDQRIDCGEPKIWLAVTSPSFDISVLELLWTLARGFCVAVHGAPAAGPDFSLFYFSAASKARAESPYRLMIEGARFADANGFEAVWTPERHFHEFGGDYPNPAVTGAALAAITSRVHIRAGSCVVPLHHPVRIAEDWSAIDALSGGRVGLAAASGWHPNDFLLAPDRFTERKRVLLTHLEQVRKLWRGEAVEFANADGEMVAVRTLPRPVQAELPVWLTVARNAEAFEVAGRLGYNVLTHLLGMSFEEVGVNIARYRAAWREAGHAGAGRVTLMLHTYVAEDDETARAIVREPMKQYLATAMDLVKQAAWTFPTILERADAAGKSPAEVFETEPLSEDERDALLEHAFERYWDHSGLMGGPERCANIAAHANAIGVDEIACLIDFGVADERVLSALPRLKEVMDAARGAPGRASVREDIIRFGATHLQCTPSMAAMLAAECAEAETLDSLKYVFIGGEALTPALVSDVRARAPNARIHNMYGPTETTIWSTTQVLDRSNTFTPLGAPIANTRLRVVGRDGGDQPALVPGELWIGGDSVAQGYWRRDDLTAERFVKGTGDSLMFRTGDLVRWRENGALEFLGRLDNQVKLRGHRIELGEIEATLMEDVGVAEAAVVLTGQAPDEARLVAYVAVARETACTEQSLRDRLETRLPAIMIPNDIIIVREMPRTPNGKIDRAGLAQLQRMAARNDNAHPDAMENALADIWRDMLRREINSLDANFFEVGGHSLMAVQLLRRVRAAIAPHMALTDLYRYPTPRSLAAHLSGSEPADSARTQGEERAAARLAARRKERSDATT